MKLSYAICVCTEARELNSLLCFLTQVKDPEDDINILVDTKHVTPQVYQVLEKFKDSIIQVSRDFNGDFSAHRNYQLSKCSGEYIFTIDADEIPQEALIKNIKQVIKDTDGDLFLIPRINICPGYTVEWLKKRNFIINDFGWINWPDYQGRVYKNQPSIKYGNKLHEQIIGATRPVRLDANPNISLWHIKSVEKQDLQDSLYKDIQP
jgi:glycosyltransferase involved in cell wall biosynthesis